MNSASHWPAVGHGLAHLPGQRLGEFRVGLSAEGVVNGGERQAKGYEGSDGEDLPVIEPGVGSARMSAGVVALGSLATFRAHPAMTFS